MHVTKNASMVLTAFSLDQIIKANNSPLGINVNNVHILQLLQNVTCNGTTTLAKVGRAAAISLAPSIDPSEATNSNSTPQVDFSCH